MNSKEYYNRYWSDEGLNPRGVLPKQLGALLDRHISSDARCLDVGCGSGRKVGMWMKARGQGYLGADVSSNAVEEARSLGLDATVINDASTLPFDHESFDVVTCVEVLEHLFNPEDAAAEMFRVLKPGGVLIATVPNTVHWARRIEFAFFGRWNPIGDHLSVDQPWRDPHLRFFTLRTLRRMISRTGFEEIESGGHAGGMARALPVVGRHFRHRESTAAYQKIEAMYPSLLAVRLHVVARKR